MKVRRGLESYKDNKERKWSLDFHSMTSLFIKGRSSRHVEISK